MPSAIYLHVAKSISEKRVFNLISLGKYWNPGIPSITGSKSLLRKCLKAVHSKRKWNSSSMWPGSIFAFTARFPEQQDTNPPVNNQPTKYQVPNEEQDKKIAGKLPTTSSLHFPSEPTHLTKHRTVVRNKSRKKSRHQFFFHINYWHIAHEKNLSPSLFLSIDTFSIRTTIADQT